MAEITNFLKMGGYAFYVWGSYGSVMILLFILWLLPWRRWQKFITKKS